MPQMQLKFFSVCLQPIDVAGLEILICPDSLLQKPL